MSAIKYYIANAAGKFDQQNIRAIGSVFKRAAKKAEQLLRVDEVDVVFFAVEDNYQLGIYGYTPNANIIHIYIDVGFENFSKSILESTLLHEFHHVMRWRKPGYGKKLGEEIITEGLATLFEEEVLGITPPYAKINLKSEQIKNAMKLLNSTKFDHSEWFYGSKKIDNWFGYAYGYRLCKEYSTRIGKKAAKLVNISAKEILKHQQH